MREGLRGREERASGGRAREREFVCLLVRLSACLSVCLPLSQSFSNTLSITRARARTHTHTHTHTTRRRSHTGSPSPLGTTHSPAHLHPIRMSAFSCARPAHPPACPAPRHPSPFGLCHSACRGGCGGRRRRAGGSVGCVCVCEGGGCAHGGLGRVGLGRVGVALRRRHHQVHVPLCV